MYALLRIEKIEQHHTGRIVVVPDSYKKEWQMCQRYAPYIKKTAGKILKRYFDITADFAKKIEVELPDWFKKLPDRIDFSPLKPSIFGLYEVSGFIDDAGDCLPGDFKEQMDDAINGIKFFEGRILGCGIEELWDRYVKAPQLFIPTFIHAKNPEALYRLYEEVVRTYSGKNYLACIALCRAILEYLLNNYYECETSAKNLSGKIKYAGEKYPNLRKYKLWEKKKTADDILHDYSGKDIEETAVIDFIRTIKYLIADIPSKKQDNQPA
ncbi:MAG TPA: hypothetical protein VFF54_07655 [Thermodesulfobacteriota bacterium]|nr:hypothetical protein [Thermodesulfobacteriota bacterium]